MNTHHAKVKFGKHDGELLTRVPVNYLNWAVSQNCNGPVDLQGGQRVSMLDAAKAEIERRGERLQTVDVSGHAVDRFSLKFMRQYNEHRLENEGLYSFLGRITEQLVNDDIEVEQDSKTTFKWNGCKFVVQNLAIPVLITVK